MKFLSHTSLKSWIYPSTKYPAESPVSDLFIYLQTKITADSLDYIKLLIPVFLRLSFLGFRNFEHVWKICLTHLSHYRHLEPFSLVPLGQKVQNLKDNLRKIQFSYKYVTCDAKRVSKRIFLAIIFKFSMPKATKPLVVCWNLLIYHLETSWFSLVSVWKQDFFFGLDLICI